MIECTSSCHKLKMMRGCYMELTGLFFICFLANVLCHYKPCHHGCKAKMTVCALTRTETSRLYLDYCRQDEAKCKRECHKKQHQREKVSKVCCTSCNTDHTLCELISITLKNEIRCNIGWSKCLDKCTKLV